MTRLLVVLTAPLLVALLLAQVAQLVAHGPENGTTLVQAQAAALPAERRQDAEGPSKCLCQASSCLCCVELGLSSSIDLGGPACVNVRNVERNVSLNLSYADRPVHNATIALAQAARKPTCMNLLSQFAQICAEFTSMKPVVDSAAQGQTAAPTAFDGCLVIEPAVLSSPQATYPVGCFRFEQGLVRQIEGPVTVAAEEDHKPDDEEEDDEPGLNAEELIAAVSASAEQGIALFSQWLGINLAPRPSNSTSSTGSPAAAAVASTREEPSRDEPSRPQERPISARHARAMSLLLDHEDKNEERFKQLLSAQDNILKESATIGNQPIGVRTAFLYSQPDAEEARAPVSAATNIAPQNLVIVPPGSRRGGRAYNIHQHVNEI